MATKSEKLAIDLQVITTGDGSHSIYNGALDEVYHSRNGAIAESEHIFIRAGFDRVLDGERALHVLEVGFGTGLNALMTAVRCVEIPVQVWYQAFEPSPLPLRLTRELNYAGMLGGDACRYWEKMHSAPNKQWHTVHDHFQLCLIAQPVEEPTLPNNHFDLVYFDAFAPSIQPELWSAEVFGKLHAALKTKGVLVTYSAMGEVRRNLIRAGFSVERLPGPPGKREMLRATKDITG